MKLNNLRKLFKEYKIDGYILSTQDEYLSEYPPSSAKRLEYLTGFTGSNGLALILKNTVLFFTDGRYLSQAHIQLDPELFQIFDQKLLADFVWKDYFFEGAIIGYNPKVFTNALLLPFKKLNLKSINDNLPDKIWTCRPRAPGSRIYHYDIAYTGESVADKIARCRDFIHLHHGASLIITNPEAVCWLLNIRASDLEFSPLALAHAYITMQDIYLFTDLSRLEPSINNQQQPITVLPEASIVETINNQQGKILFDDNLCSKYLSDIIVRKEHQNIPNPCMLWKACKNPVEISGMIEAHIHDGVAICEFLAFLANTDLSTYSEYDLGLKLTNLRSRGENYVMDSFPAIIGFQENGAIIHYRALEENAKKIKGAGLLLIDSGGQYLGGTTDITRVISIGRPENAHQKYYTIILKGHLALTMAKFPKNSVTGANLDILARQFLWQEGRDYPHGTGHGVGSFLSVHEGPQNISLNSYRAKFAAGMVVSNEPGYYVPGEFGIRIENMMYVKKGTIPNFLEFEALTLVPYAKELIDLDLLTSSEREYLTGYYKAIEKKIMPHLSPEAKKWLKTQLELL